MNFISYLSALSVTKDVGFRVLKGSSGHEKALPSVLQELCSYQFIEPLPRSKLGSKDCILTI